MHLPLTSHRQRERERESCSASWFMGLVDILLHSRVATVVEHGLLWWRPPGPGLELDVSTKRVDKAKRMASAQCFRDGTRCRALPCSVPSALLLLLPRVPVAARGTVLLRGTPGCADAVAAGQVHAWTCSPARKHAGHGCSPTRLFFLLLCAFLSCRRHGEHPRPRQPAGDVTPSVARWGHPWRGLFILVVLPVWGV